MKHIITKKSAIITLVIAILLGAGVWVFMASRDTGDEGRTESVLQGSNINYDPPTEEEKQAANDQKQENADRDKAVDEAQKTKQPAQIIVTDASYYQAAGDVVEVRAYLSNVYEDGGTCTATLTKGGRTVTKTSTAFKDARSTQCGALDIPRSEFPEVGDWQVVVGYESGTTTGKSDAQTVSIRPQ